MNSTRSYISLGIVTICIIGAGTIAFVTRKQPAPPVAPVQVTQTVPVVPTPIPTPKTPPPVASLPKQTASVYKDGTYTTTGTYDSPAGYETIRVTLTLSHDIVTSASVTNMAGDHTSSRYQDRFIGGYQPYVVGKNINTINLGVISGSSLTPIGFNNALISIKAKAKA